MENKRFKIERLPAVLNNILLHQSLKSECLAMANRWYHQLRAQFELLLDAPSVTLEMKLRYDFKDVTAPVSFLLTKVGSLISISCQIPGKKPFAIFTLSPDRELLLDECGEPVNNVGGQFCRELLDLYQEELPTQASK